jgi:hypothetical protein
VVVVDVVVVVVVVVTGMGVVTATGANGEPVNCIKVEEGEVRGKDGAENDGE